MSEPRPSVSTASVAVAAAAARLDRLLRTWSSVWLGTVRSDGAPHVVPIWFSWDAERAFIASKPNAMKVRNARANARVTLAVGEPDDDFDVGLIEGLAHLPDRPAREIMPPDHLDRYRGRLAAAGLAPDDYWATYSQAIVVTPTRFLSWHGRTEPRSASPAFGQPTAA
jgi:PPOX class probable F420-dependent enzyme